MKFIVEVQFSDEIIMQAKQLNQGDRVHYLQDKIEDGLEGGYYNQVDAYLVEGLSKFEADPNYIEQVYLALEQVNPNDAATEVWDDGAIGELANYLKANDYDASDLLADGLQLYAKYDLIKWTRYNF